MLELSLVDFTRERRGSRRVVVSVDPSLCTLLIVLVRRIRWWEGHRCLHETYGLRRTCCRLCAPSFLTRGSKCARTMGNIFDKVEERIGNARRKRRRCGAKLTMGRRAMVEMT
ncbi:hypothetical protein B296_00026226 [Ensete ventricosum]|uniref:Uncharacterized protein n=1 Tax=Ensete ventricosum TaxID=4639 RepID=A0A426XNR6_ENSVE|nr:hypothetical protein B296_00026226 [Ensete ventricosum]